MLDAVNATITVCRSCGKKQQRIEEKGEYLGEFLNPVNVNTTDDEMNKSANKKFTINQESKKSGKLQQIDLEL